MILYYAQALYVPQYRAAFITTRWFRTMLGTLYAPRQRAAFITAHWFPYHARTLYPTISCSFHNSTWFRTMCSGALCPTTSCSFHNNPLVSYTEHKGKLLSFFIKGFSSFFSYPADFLAKDK
ncbi:hypothetical protein JCM10003_3883 [Bacteroides pyogenes JCM 10003]|nr:hypothetical protein JCM10003_3883 [Bacteroides pyogenes JCM 10003]